MISECGRMLVVYNMGLVSWKLTLNNWSIMISKSAGRILKEKTNKKILENKEPFKWIVSTFMAYT
jgi:hypothetical protein